MDIAQKRKSYSFHFKFKALQLLAQYDGNVSNTANELNVTRSNLQRWRIEKKKIKKQVTSINVSSRKKMRTREGKAKYPLLEKAILSYIKEKREKRKILMGKRFGFYIS